MKKILLFDTAIASSNLGDEIILSSTKAGLAPIIRNSLLFRLGTHIENYSPFQMFLHKYIKQDSKMHLIAETADLKFICGTNLLADNLFRFRSQFMLNQFNKSLYKDAIFVGVGRIKNFKVFENKYTENLYKKTLSQKYVHSVRDEETKEVLDSIGIRSVNTGCPTLWMMTKEKCSIIPRKKADSIIFSVSGYTGLQDPANDKLMIECLLNNYKKRYVWIQTTADESYLRSLIDPEKNNIELVYSLDYYHKILSNGNIDYVGSRLHGGVFALQHNVRTLVIAIDERAIGFHESTNIPILHRKNTASLEKIINDEIITDIHVREKEIKKFIEQFQ